MVAHIGPKLIIFLSTSRQVKMKIQDIDLYEVLCPDFRWTHEGCFIGHCKLHKDRYLNFYFRKESVCVVGLPKSFLVYWPRSKSATAFCDESFMVIVRWMKPLLPFHWLGVRPDIRHRGSGGEFPVGAFNSASAWGLGSRFWEAERNLPRLLHWLCCVFFLKRHKSPWIQTIPKCLILLEAIRFNDIGQMFRIHISVGRSDV